MNMQHAKISVYFVVLWHEVGYVFFLPQTSCYNAILPAFNNNR
jgi:hypothetical protein